MLDTYPTAELHACRKVLLIHTGRGKTLQFTRVSAEKRGGDYGPDVQALVEQHLPLMDEVLPQAV